MNSGITLKTIGSGLVVLGFWMTVGWVLYRNLKKSYDPGRLISKWVITGVALVILVLFLPGAGKFTIALGLIVGLIIAITWARDICSLVADPLGNIIDGGSDKVEDKPFYSRAEGFRRRNQFHEAIAEIRKQLDKFPQDFAGQMLLAEINAENLKDLQSAEILIRRIVGQSGHTSGQITGALHALADWHMKLAQDPDSSRLVLEQIIERFPDSNFSQTASQRIAHLGSVDSLLATHERPAIALKHFEQQDLRNPQSSEAKPIPDAAARSAACLKQLEQHPLDSEAREMLALIYANEQQRLDLATGELEELIAQTNRRPREVARWLNLLAELQIKVGNDVAAADKTVRRILELFPGTAYAEQAMVRLEYLRLEAKRNETTEIFKLGSYEKDMGLKNPAR